MRAYALVFINGLLHGVDVAKLTAAIPHGGDACGKIGRAPLGLLKMGVHVPQAGQDRFSFCRNHQRILRHGYLAGCTNAFDFPVFEKKRCVGKYRTVFYVHRVAANDGRQRLRCKRRLAGGLCKKPHAIYGGPLDELRKQGLVRLVHHFHLVAFGIVCNQANQLAFVIGPQHLGAPDQALNHVAVYGQWLAVERKAVPAVFKNGKGTGRQGRQGLRSLVGLTIP